MFHIHSHKYYISYHESIIIYRYTEFYLICHSTFKPHLSISSIIFYYKIKASISINIQYLISHVFRQKYNISSFLLITKQQNNL